MIYRDRKYLPILTLTEDRDYVTYDELIHVLEEQPSDAVYIERNGILCGLLTSGHIGRSCVEKIRRVMFSVKFTAVRPGEYMRVRQIFKDRGNINVLPVVSEDGHLLGEYVRWNDLISTDYAEILCKDPYVLQDLNADIHRAVFVEPSAQGGALRHKMFSWWRHKLEREGIQLQVIQHREIKDYLNDGRIFLFVDECEKRGAESLNNLYPKKETTQPIQFVSIVHYYHIRRLASGYSIVSLLKELQNQNVHVLVFDFKENSNQFLAVLTERIKKRDEEYGVYPLSVLPEKLKKSFADDLYCEAYKTQVLPLTRQSLSFHTRSGIHYLSDTETEFLHIQNSERLTVNQPEQYERCIYLYGPCVVMGIYVPDRYTIPSLLQSEINRAGFSCKVVNRGFPGMRGYYLGSLQARLQSESFKQGDIIVLDQSGSQLENFPTLNLTDALEKNDAPADWFHTDPRHCNHKANQVYAQAIYDELVPVLQQPIKERSSLELDHDYIDRLYLRHYFPEFDPANHGTVGSIVMNCNPFTLGHRFLIEEALKAVDFLIIFVVEEDESLFSFQERFAMVCQGTSDLEHIMVVPSGPYILSKNTFPEYFQKIDDEDLKKNTEDDVTLFAEKIAPRLGITYRFVGEEREDKVTNEYNEAMNKILPRYGIQVMEIPRKENSQSVISASRVRQCLSTNRMDELDMLVPASTKRILFFEGK